MYNNKNPKMHIMIIRQGGCSMSISENYKDISSILRTDITAGKAFLSFIDMSRIAVCIGIPEKDLILYANDTFFTETGIDESGFRERGFTLLAGIHPEDIELYRSTCIKAVSERTSAELRYITSSNGSIRWLRLDAAPADFLTVNGAIAATVHNITSAKTLEQDMEYRLERYKIFEITTPEVLFEYHPAEDSMTFSSNNGSKITRTVTCEYMKKCKPGLLVHPDDIKRFISALATACAAPVSATLEYRSRVINSTEYRWCRTYYSSVANKLGVVTAVFGRVQDITAEVEKNRDLMRRAELDPMTGIYNKTAFTARAKERIASADSEKSVYFAIIDIDNFKHFNDTYGHQTGDKVLKTTADMIKTHIPDGVCGRFGGDEFIVLSEANDKGSPSELFEHMLGCSCCEIGGSRCEVNLSIGLCVSDKRTSYDDFFREADKALYTAKKSGKNRVVMSHI